MYATVFCYIIKRSHFTYILGYNDDPVFKRLGRPSLAAFPLFGFISGQDTVGVNFMKMLYFP